MALSGSVNFNMTAQQLIDNAFSKIGVKKMEQPLIAAELQDGIDNLNLMMKSWQAQGLHLWSMEEGVLFLDAGVNEYSLGATGDHACRLSDFVGAETTADAVTGDVILTLESTTGMASNDYIGIELDDGTREWKTIATVDSATQVTFCALDGLTSTTLTSARTTGQTVMPVASSAGMTAGNNVAVILTSGSIDLTTIASVDSSTQITLTVALTGNAANGNAVHVYATDTGLSDDVATGNTVFTYTTLIERPMRILSFRRKTYGYDDELEVTAWPRNKYFNQTNKTAQGTVVNAYYSPQLSDGKVYVWQTASSVNQLLRFTYEKPIDDIDLSTDNLEFPVEWLDCISTNLAAKLAVIYDVPPAKTQMLFSLAQGSLDNMLGFDQENESLNISPTGY